MSARKSKRRSSGRLRDEEQEEQAEAVPVFEEETPSTQPARKRRIVKPEPGTAEARQNRSRSRSIDNPAAAAAAAAGGDDDPSPPPAAPPRYRQEVVQFNQQEAVDMLTRIQGLEAKAEEARDKAAALDIPSASLENLVSKVVRLMLFKHYEKPGVPVKRQEINETITAESGKGSRNVKKLPGLVLPIAAAKLAQAFGLELHELKRHAAGGAGASGAVAAAAAAAAASGGAQSYVVRSMLPSALIAHFCQDRVDDQERGFRTLVLALLQLNGGKMEADELWRHLGQVQIRKDDRDAALCFGGKHPTQILEQMERTRYLITSKQAATGSDTGMQTLYEWGEAAQDELGGESLKSLVDQWLVNGPGAAPGVEEDAA